jgi:hypothetical protein
VTSTGTPAGAPRRIVQLPVRDVSIVDPQLRSGSASVTRLPDSAETTPDVSSPGSAPVPQPRSGVTGQVRCDEDRDGDDAVLALVTAQEGFAAAAAAADRVQLPSLIDFLA